MRDRKILSISRFSYSANHHKLLYRVQSAEIDTVVYIFHMASSPVASLNNRDKVTIIIRCDMRRSFLLINLSPGRVISSLKLLASK